MQDVIAGHLYDYPKYYDLVFGSDWKAEIDFLQACFAKHARLSVKRLFEPACGTGTADDQNGPGRLRDCRQRT